MTILKTNEIQTKLTREQKEAVGLLSIGTFLEYFDLMLYVHMAVLLNELFFPKTDPHTAQLLSAFAFCSTYLLRPFGAIIFGWIGDNIGRKATVIITTVMMGLSCIIMANTGTYNEIGIKAAYIVTICRIVQGMSSLGEIVGAELYLTESVKPPMRYPTVAIIVVVSALGGTAALGVASLVTSMNFNWRAAFWIGAMIAFVGTVARTSLRETPDFVNAKNRLKNSIELADLSSEGLEKKAIWNQKINMKAVLAYFVMESVSPIYFYLIYIHCAGILKSLGLSAEEVLGHNFIISTVNLLNTVILTFVVYKVHPIKILEYRFIVLAPIILAFPYVMSNAQTSSSLLIIQIAFAFFSCTAFPANPIIFSYFPVLKRFTCATFAFAASKAIMYFVTAFGTVYLTTAMGNYGLLIILIPINIAYLWALLYFKNLEVQAGNYHKKTRTGFASVFS